MKIAIGTLRAPKIDGIKEGVASCPYFDDVRGDIEFIAESVSSDVPHMPTTFDEVLRGAKNRADNLVKVPITADFYVGIEGGTTHIEGRPYLFGCVYVRDTGDRGHFGLSPMVEVPEACARMIYDEGHELGPIMEELSGIVDLRSVNGSMGAWTNDMLTRKDEFALAFKSAIAPFYNPFYKMP